MKPELTCIRASLECIWTGQGSSSAALRCGSINIDVITEGQSGCQLALEAMCLL